jgi:hypothetical protein
VEIKTNQSRLSGDFDVRRRTAGRGNRLTLFAQAIEMKVDCLAHISFALLAGRAGRGTSRQIRRISRESSPSGLKDYQVFHFKPACFRMLFSVPGANSSPSLPGTVTTPRLVGWLNCRWLPRVRTCLQPSASMSRMTSRTFIDSIVTVQLIGSNTKRHVTPGEPFAITPGLDRTSRDLSLWDIFVGWQLSQKLAAASIGSWPSGF